VAAARASRHRRWLASLSELDAAGRTFKSHAPVEARVVSRIDLAHPAGADLFADFVMP